MELRVLFVESLPLLAFEHVHVATSPDHGK
jgi:hypothetical protein